MSHISSTLFKKTRLTKKLFLILIFFSLIFAQFIVESSANVFAEDVVAGLESSDSLDNETQENSTTQTSSEADAITKNIRLTFNLTEKEPVVDPCEIDPTSSECQCAEGYHLNERGICVKDEEPHEPCAAGFHRDWQGECVEDEEPDPCEINPEAEGCQHDPGACPSGYHRDEDTETCVRDEQQETCPTGYIRKSDGECYKEDSPFVPNTDEKPWGDKPDTGFFTKYKNEKKKENILAVIIPISVFIVVFISLFVIIKRVSQKKYYKFQTINIESKYGRKQTKGISKKSLVLVLFISSLSTLPALILKTIPTFAEDSPSDAFSFEIADEHEGQDGVIDIELNGKQGETIIKEINLDFTTREQKGYNLILNLPEVSLRLQGNDSVAEIETIPETDYSNGISNENLAALGYSAIAISMDGETYYPLMSGENNLIDNSTDKSATIYIAIHTIDSQATGTYSFDSFSLTAEEDDRTAKALLKKDDNSISLNFVFDRNEYELNDEIIGIYNVPKKIKKVIYEIDFNEDGEITDDEKLDIDQIIDLGTKYLDSMYSVGEDYDAALSLAEGNLGKWLSAGEINQEEYSIAAGNFEQTEDYYELYSIYKEYVKTMIAAGRIDGWEYNNRMDEFLNPIRYDAALESKMKKIYLAIKGNTERDEIFGEDEIIYELKIYKSIWNYFGVEENEEIANQVLSGGYLTEWMLDMLTSEEKMEQYEEAETKKVIIEDSFKYFKPNSTNMWFFYMPFTEIEGIENINTTELTDASAMFAMSGIETLDLSNFDTSNIENISFMLAASELKSLELPENFGQNAKDASSLFAYMGSEVYDKINVLDVSKINLSKAEDMSLLFAGFNGGYVLPCKFPESFKTDNAKNMAGMFASSMCLPQFYIDYMDLAYKILSKEYKAKYYTYALASQDIEAILGPNNELPEDYDELIASILAEFRKQVEDGEMTEDEYEQIEESVGLPESYVELASRYSSLLEQMIENGMMTEEEVEAETSKYQPENYGDILANYRILLEEEYSNGGLSAEEYNNKISGIENISEMDYSLDISNFNTSNVEEMSFMFGGVNMVTSLKLTFDTSKVKRMYAMFSGLSIENLDLSELNTENVKNMVAMFSTVARYKEIKITLPENFGKNALTMNQMFVEGYGSYEINPTTDEETGVYYSIDFPKGFGENVVDLDGMFDATESELGNIRFPDGFGSKAKIIESMFRPHYYYNEFGSLTFSGNFISESTVVRNNNWLSGRIYKGLIFGEGFGKNLKDASNLFAGVMVKDGNFILPDGFGKDIEIIDSMFQGLNILSEENDGGVLYLPKDFGLNLKSADDTFYCDFSYKKNYCVSKIIVQNDWNTENIPDDQQIFSWTYNLTGGAGTKFDNDLYGQYGKNYAHIDQGKLYPGFFTILPKQTNYKIHFINDDPGNIKNVPADLEVENDQGYNVFALPQNIPTRDGYVFMGWSDNNTGYANTFQPNEEIPVYQLDQTGTREINLYPKWSEPYNVTFDSNGGIFDGENTENHMRYLIKDQEFFNSVEIIYPERKNKNYIVNYENNIDYTTDYITIHGASFLKIDLSVITEKNHDYVYLIDGDENVVRAESGFDCNYSGILGRSWSVIKVEGDKIKIRFTSDSSNSPSTTCSNVNLHGYQGYWARISSARRVFMKEGDYQEPTRSGYSFIGWSSNPSATTGDTIEQIESGKITEPKTYYAIWRSNTSYYRSPQNAKENVAQEGETQEEEIQIRSIGSNKTGEHETPYDSRTNPLGVEESIEKKFDIKNIAPFALIFVALIAFSLYVYRRQRGWYRYK